MHITIGPERPDTPDAVALIDELEAHLAPQYPAASRHGYSVDRLLREGVVFYVLRADGEPAACGGVQFVDDDGGYGEIKRMFVRPAFRGIGLGKRVLATLEDAARARGVARLRLETGVHQTDAIALYERVGYRPIGPFGPYGDDPLSRYYEKRLA